MYQETTRSIRVTVEPTYRPDQSAPEESRFVWAYQVRIENLGKETAEKAHAAWVYIFNAWGESLKRNKPVAANCDRAGDVLQCTGNQAP